VKLADAPKAGWYPDPRGGTRLRWWDGGDWTDDYRVRPTQHELASRSVPTTAPAQRTKAAAISDAVEQSGAARRDAEAIISEVRKVARSEVERAADLFSARARAATREIEPLITKYSMKFMRPFKIASVILVIAFVGWVVFQFIVQQSFYDWIGDRIDNLTD
jgi:Protein of unknown function (DUF2510)